VETSTPCTPPRPAVAAPCRSRRVFDIRLDRRMRAARVRVGGRPATVRRAAGGRLRARIDLRGRRAGRVTVLIAGVTRSGTRLRQRREYRTCAPGRD